MRCEHVGAWTRWVSLADYDDAVWENHGQEFGGGIMDAADKMHCFSIDTCTFNSTGLESVKVMLRFATLPDLQQPDTSHLHIVRALPVRQWGATA